MILDFAKTTNALLGLKTDEGQRNLETLYGHLKDFRGKLGVDLNDAEFRYVMQTLFNEQVVTQPEPERVSTQPKTLAHGFTIRAFR